SGVINLPTGATYQINGTNVLTNNTLGGGVTASSLTSVGLLSSLNVSGNVGIGTTSPNSLLDVSSADTVNNASTTLLTLDHSSTGANPAANIGAGLLFRNMNSASSTVNTASIVGLLSNVSSGSEAGQLLFYTRTGGGGLTEGMRLDNSGNLGIGTSSPGSLLSLGATNGINFRTATSSFNSTGGINLANGCFASNGTCLSQNAGTVTSVTGTYPVQSTGGATPTISLAFGTTSANVFSSLQQFSGQASTTA